MGHWATKQLQQDRRERKESMEEYEDLEIEVVEFDSEDVITMSNIEGSDG